MTTANEMRELRAVSIASANQIREIHSLVVSLSQSQTSLRTQSVGASVSFTTAREIPAATNGGTRLPLDVGLLTQRVLREDQVFGTTN